MKIYNKKNSKVSIRYCKNCKRVNRFKYNQFIGHSECSKCLGRSARELTKLEFDNLHIKIKHWDID